jgi:tetratricopeptide (TPR) repeat protein
MNRFLPILALLLALVYVSTTGFQCGSAETTSAKLYMQQKQWQKAEESLLKEVTKNPKNEEAWYLLGTVRYEVRNFTGMNEAYTKTLELGVTHKKDIDNARLAVWAQEYNDGVSLYNKGKEDAANYDKAAEAFAIAIAMVPDSSGTYYVAALARYAKKDFAGARTLLETALVKKPDFADAARFLGQLYYASAAEKTEAKDSAGARIDYGKAATAFEAAYKADPTNAETITALIEAYERVKQSDKAFALTRDAVAKDPNNKVYRYAYGVFMLKQEKFAEGIEQFQKAVEIDPTYTDATYNLGVSYLNWGVSLKAESDRKAEEARKVSKGKDVKEDLTYKEKFKAALPYLEKSAEMRSDDAALWQQLGKLYINLNMKDKSEAAFKKFDALMKK